MVLPLAFLTAAALAADRDGPSRLIPTPPPGPAPGILPLPRSLPVAVVPLPVPRRSLPPFGRACVPGFVPNAWGVCARHDDPRVVCAPPEAGGGCAVVPPGPAPYGPGPLLRLDY